MSKDGKEARSERVNVSLKPSTLAILQRLSAATGTPVATIISEQIELTEGVFKLGAALAERQRAAREKAAKAQERDLERQLKGGS